MTTEFFTDRELDIIRKALTLVANDLHGLSTKAHDFSKQRMAFKLRCVADDLSTIQRSLPQDEQGPVK